MTTPAEWQTVIDGLPSTLFLADLVFVADIEDDHRIETVRELILNEDPDDEIFPLALLGVDHQTSTPGVLLVPLSMKVLKSLIAEAEGK